HHDDVAAAERQANMLAVLAELGHDHATRANLLDPPAETELPVDLLDAEERHALAGADANADLVLRSISHRSQPTTSDGLPLASRRFVAAPAALTRRVDRPSSGRFGRGTLGPWTPTRSCSKSPI